MRHLLLYCLLLFSVTAFAQNKKRATFLIKKGLRYQQYGKYDKAIAAYEDALKVDKQNVYALAELAMTYTTLKKYRIAINFCKKVIKYHPHSPVLRDIYVQLGTCYDLRGQPKKSIKTYDKGLVLFPDYYLLHFNKGVTQLNGLDTVGALASFQNAVKTNPKHASSHYHIGSIEAAFGHRIPSILALSRFLTIEPMGERATTAENALLSLMNTTRQKNDSSVVIALSRRLADPTYQKNDFREVELLFSLQSVMDKNNPKRMTDEAEGIRPVNDFKVKFERLCYILQKNQESNTGFYWDFYTPFFVQMGTNDHIHVFAYLVHLQQEEYKIAINEWLEDHEGELDQFSKWSKSYRWIYR